MLPGYHQPMTKARAAEICQRGAGWDWGGGSPLALLLSMAQAAGSPLTAICIAGGPEYQQTAAAFLAHATRAGAIAPTATSLIVDPAQSGARGALKRWIVSDA